jgi:hypothetical protein
MPLVALKESRAIIDLSQTRYATFPFTAKIAIDRRAAG